MELRLMEHSNQLLGDAETLRADQMIWRMFKKSERRGLGMIFILMLVGAVLEMFSLGLVVPIVGLLVNPDYIDRVPFVRSLFGELSTTQYVLGAMGLLVGVYILKTIFLIWKTWIQRGFSNEVTIRMAQDLYENYLRQPYAFHLERNSAIMIRNSQNSASLMSGVIDPFLLIASEFLVSGGLLVLMLLLEPVGSLSAIIVFGSFSLIFRRFTSRRIANWGKAQLLMDEMLSINWIDELNKFSDDIFPSRQRAVGKMPYHWSAYQTEWATDLAFNATADLDARYPSLVKYALNTSDTATVLRFLGKKVTATGQAHGKFAQEVTARRVHRLPGTCVKYHVGQNSLKFYNKHGNVFRAEATINKPQVFNVFRQKEGRLTAKQWLPMRMSVVDIKRRAEVSQHMNNRLLDHLATVSDDQPLESLISGLAQPITWRAERLRGLDLFGKDRALVDVLIDPAIAIAGIRNRDLASCLKKSTQGKGKTDKQRSGMATRLLRLLRAHGLIKKITKTHRYQLTDKGITTINAIKSALSASTKKLNDLAA